MREIQTIESEIYEKAEDGIHIKLAGMINAMDAFNRLKEHLQEQNMLPDEYFLPSLYMDEKTKLPEFSTAICHTDWGGNEGIYIDIELMYVEDRQKKSFHFATGKTLGSSGDDFLKMSRIAAECSIMLNGRGFLVRVSENQYNAFKEQSEEKGSLDKMIHAAEDKTVSSAPTNEKLIEAERE